MKALEKVRLKKLAATEVARYRTASKDEYVPGGFNPGVSPPVDYEVVGTVVFDIEPEGFILIDREERNGEKVPGLFRSSRVQKVNKKDDGTVIVETYNSVYLIEPA